MKLQTPIISKGVYPLSRPTMIRKYPLIEKKTVTIRTVGMEPY